MAAWSCKSTPFPLVRTRGLAVLSVEDKNRDADSFYKNYLRPCSCPSIAFARNHIGDEVEWS